MNLCPTKRIISEVAGTISTNGIQELSKEERGGVSDYSYVRDCIIASVYNAIRSFPGFSMSFGEFTRAVEHEVHNSRGAQRKETLTKLAAYDQEIRI